MGLVLWMVDLMQSVDLRGGIVPPVAPSTVLVLRRVGDALTS